MSSDHFVMSAVLVKDQDLPKADALLATIRTALLRAPGQTLHWRNLKQHSSRLYIAQQIGSSPFLLLCSVVVCKRHLPDVGLTEDQAYLFTLRFLLERLSWVARDTRRELHYTVAHVVRFKLKKLREYEAILRQTPGCQIAWAAMDPRGGRLDQPSRVEGLQLADTVASATFAAFEPDQFGNTEQRYLCDLAPRLYRRGSGTDGLTSYGLKIHPGTAQTAYPWVAALSASTG